MDFHFFFAAVAYPGIYSVPLYLGVFLLGISVGSFLNVCIYRLPLEGISIASPARSSCPSCEEPIRWYDNIPLLSYLFLRGRCRSCKTAISLQYPLVELMTGVMAVALLKRFGLHPATPLLFAFVCALIVITFIDLAHWIIPDVISLPGLALGLLAALTIGPPHLPSLQSAALGALVGGGSLLAISLFYSYVLQRQGMGLGDAKLLAMIGAFLGLRAIPLVVLLAALQGTVVSLILYLLGWRHGVPQFDDDEDEDNHNEDQHNQQQGEGDEDNKDQQQHQQQGDEYNKDQHNTNNTPVNKAASDIPPTTTKDDESAGLEDDESAGLEDDESAGLEDVESAGAKSANIPPEEKSEDVPPEEDLPEETIGFRQAAIPFGPFLALGALEYLFWGQILYHWWLLR